MKTTGLKIGGTVGPDEIVGMHVKMPTTPGVGVSVEVTNRVDEDIKQILEKMTGDDEKSQEIRSLAKGIVEEKDSQQKLNKIKDLVSIASGITAIAGNIFNITKIIGQ